MLDWSKNVQDCVHIVNKFGRELCSMSGTFKQKQSPRLLFLTQTNIQNAVDLQCLYVLGHVCVGRGGLGLLKLFTATEGNPFTFYIFLSSCLSGLG